MEWWLSAPFLKRRYWKYFNVLFFFGICPLSFFVHDCMSSFALSASCLTLQIEFHYRLSDCSFAFQITATAQTLLVAFLVPAEGSTHACAQRAVIRVVWFWPVLSIRVPLLHLLLGWNVPWCIGGMLIYQEVSPWRSGALWRSFIIIFLCVCGSHSFNHCSRHLPGPWKKHD